jgi:CIC family chloride channel protein
MMAVVLVFELSGDYAIVVPLLVATAVATLLSRRLRAESIYGAELRRRGFAWEMTLDGRRLLASRGAPTAEVSGAGRPPPPRDSAPQELRSPPENVDGSGNSG